MAISAASVFDTDSDGEPNTTDANIFWGNLKTPEKTRTVNDLPQTILRPRSTFQTQLYDSPSKSSTNYHSKTAIQCEGGIGDPQITPIDTSIQTGNVNFEVRYIARVSNYKLGAPSPSNLAAKNTDPISMQSPGYNETIHSLVDGQNTIPETCNNAIEHNTPLPGLSMSGPETSLPVATNCLGVFDATPVQSRKECPITPYVTPFANSTLQLSHLASQFNTDVPAQIKTPIKLVDVHNDQSTPSARHPIFLGTPGARDTSARKERRTKWKHDESQGRHPLLSLSPSSTSILNEVQSPVRESHHKINIASSPIQKAQRLPAPALSHRSPTKPLRLGFFPSSVNLNDPNRIPARRIVNLHSPLRSMFIHSPARRIPVINNDRTVVNPSVPKMLEQTSDVSAPSSSTHSRPTSSQPCELPTIRHPRDMFTSGLLSVKTPQKIVDTARSNSVASIRPGLSRLPVPSSRSGRPPSLLSIQKRFDRAATTPSRIPSPLKRKAEVEHHVPKPVEIQMRHLQSGLKRKRTDDASEDDADERPQKRMIHAPKEEDELTAESSIRETTEPSRDSDNPFAMSIDTSPLQSPVREHTSDRKTTEHSGIPIMSTPSTSLNPRRPSRGRKRTSTLLNDKSIESELLPSRKSSVTKSLSKSSSRPSSRTATRGGINLEIWPETPRELQLVTSINTQHNQASLVELEHQIIRKFGNRPPSPSSKFRVDTDNKSREEREARAERRHRRDKGGDTVMFNGGEGDEAVAPSELTHETKHVQAPGDDEDYQTPIKDPIPSKLHPDRMTKTVKWSRSLIDAPPITSRPNTSGQTALSEAESKSCFLRDPKTLSLNFLGNIPNAEEPLAEVVKEHFVVSKFIYDDDIQESPRRSKKKAAMKI